MTTNNNKGIECEHEVPEGHKYCQKCGKEYGVDYFEEKCPPHEPTGEWEVRGGKSYANCKRCGKYETSLKKKEDTIPSPLTMEEETSEWRYFRTLNLPFDKAYAEKDGLRFDLEEVNIKETISSAVTQALKEQYAEIYDAMILHSKIRLEETHQRDYDKGYIQKIIQLS